MELAQALGERDVQIALLTMGRRLSSEQKSRAEALAHVSVHETEFKLEWMENPWQDVRAAGERLLELEKSFAPDIVHLNGYAHAALDWRAPKLVVCHSCVLSWWGAVNTGLDVDQKWERYRREVAAGLRAADVVAAPTQAMLCDIDRCYGSLRTRSVVVRNGLSPDLFTPGNKQPYIFAAGRLWDPAKNIAALQRISDELDWPVYTAGDMLDPQGNPKESVTSPNYYSLGFQTREQIARWLSAASIYCAPARYEPFGLAILEAALSGCALVLGDIPSLRELWDGAAVFVQPNDTNGIATALQELIANSSYREKCGRRARMRGLAFTPARMAAGYEYLYKSMLQNNKFKPAKSSEALACAS
jgi:glycosyltransferase involved in cell wall biosynthesis